MLYQISYHFKDERDPDEGFYDLLGELGSYQLGFDGFLLLDAPYTAAGLKEELDGYFQNGARGSYFINRAVKDCSGRINPKSKKFISERWHRIPAVNDLGTLPTK